MRRKLCISNIMVIYSFLPRLLVVLSSGGGSVASRGKPRGHGSVASIYHIRKKRKNKRKLNNESIATSLTPTGAPRGFDRKWVYAEVKRMYQIL